MRAKIIKPFTYSPDGATEVTLPIGAIVEGYIAEKAARNHYACAMFPEAKAETKIAPPPEVKAKGRRR